METWKHGKTGKHGSIETSMGRGIRGIRNDRSGHYIQTHSNTTSKCIQTQHQKVRKRHACIRTSPNMIQARIS